MAEALDECTMRGMTPERIYLLARMGSTRAALELIMRELVDVEQAVQFCKEQDDQELWEDLIRCSLDKPTFLIVLLNNVGTHIDPRQLVERIEPGLEIPGLRQSLIQILRDYNLQVSLQEGCKRILVSDCYSLLTRKVRGASRGLLVSSEASCPECGEVIVREGAGAEVKIKFKFSLQSHCTDFHPHNLNILLCTLFPSSHLIITVINPFFICQDLAVLACRHTFHTSCIGQSVICTVCNKGGDSGGLSGHTSTYYYKET